MRRQDVVVRWNELVSNPNGVEFPRLPRPDRGEKRETRSIGDVGIDLIRHVCRRRRRVQVFVHDLHRQFVLGRVPEPLFDNVVRVEPLPVFRRLERVNFAVSPLAAVDLVWLVITAAVVALLLRFGPALSGVFV